ncbi:MAG: YHYH domain-containing protein [Acidovorax sp.]|nr:YHYH domain-containing protein [Acidovorax sp.]
MKILLTALAIAAASIGFSAPALAHSGGTDSQGCHTDHKTGLRHCH